MGLCLSTRRRPPSLWSDLPPELGGLILRRLPSHDDRLSFSAVCRQWRLAAQQERSSLPPSLPWVRLNDGTFQSLPGGELRRFNFKALDVHNTGGAAIRLCSCSYGWLMYQTVSATSCATMTISRLLVNPFTSGTIQVPPPLEKEKDNNNMIGKMIVCSPDLFAAIHIISYRTAVGFYRPGARSPSWSVSPPAPTSTDERGRARRCRYIDIAFHRGKLYALTDTDELYSHELIVHDNDVDGDKGPSHAVEHVIKEPSSAVMDDGYLVASSDKLLMVKWYALLGSLRARSIQGKCEGIKFKVFEADLEMGRWSEVKGGLDGQTLFVSSECSRAIRLSSNDHGFHGDHVYFLGADLDFVDSCFRSYLYGCYDMRNDRIRQMFLNKKRINIKDISSPGWFFPSYGTCEW